MAAEKPFSTIHLALFPAGKGEAIISEGHPHTPGNPDASGLHAPYFISLLVAKHPSNEW